MRSTDVDPTWRRIAGFHIEENGEVGVIWLAHDTMSDVTWLYDACLFRREPNEIVGGGINARGRWIPLAWHKEAKPYVDELINDRGINVLPEPCEDTPHRAAEIALRIVSRMRSSRFIPERHLLDWRKEYERYNFRDEKVELKGFPLMSATRHAIEMLTYAMAQDMPASRKSNRPDIRVI